MAPKKIYFIFIFASLIKIMLVLFLNRNGTLEIFEYETIANNILNGNGFLYYFFGVPYMAYVQPFYPIFSAIIYYLTNHSHIIMGMIQSIISSVLAFIIYYIAKKITGTKEALLAAFLTAFHPALTVCSVLKLHPLVFDTFFYLLTVSLILRFINLPSNRNALLTGSVVGFTLLSRTTIFPFVALCLVYIYIMLNDEMKKRYLFIICLSAIMVYSPWVIRNYIIFHKFVLMQTSSGENLWVGNNPAASGSVLLDSGESVFERMPERMREDLSKLDELSQVRYYNRFFINFISDKPILFVKLFLKKIYYFWWFSPRTGILYPKSWLKIYKIYYGILFLFFIIGIFSALKNKSRYPNLIVSFLYLFSISFIHALVNIDTRHRWTVEPIMIIFAAIGFFKILSLLRMRGKTC